MSTAKLEVDDVVASPEAEERPIRETQDDEQRATSDNAKRVLKRFHPSASQLRRMMELYDVTPTPSADAMRLVAEETTMPLSSVVLWFKNRRARFPHPRASDQPVRSPSGKRHYAKSGMYSKASMAKRAVEKELHGGSDGAKRHKGDSSEGDENNPEREQGDFTHRMNQHLELEELIGDSNSCSKWDSAETLRQCCAFCHKYCKNQEQVAFLEEAGAKFFLEENQSGFTICSGVQSIEETLRVLDGVLQNPGFERLSSGARTTLREFICKIRSGKAANEVYV